jgi:phosphotriesterase-related protein
VRAGIIGEIGCSVPISANEKKVLRACALAQKRTGAPMDIHPSYDDELVLEMMEILSSAGADLSHTVISHMDVFDVGLDTQIRLLEAGCHIAYDNFGNLGYPHMYLGRIVNLAGDLERIRNIRQLIDRGYQQHILIGQDICFKDMLRAYGGFGYAHLLENVAPLMRAKEMTQDQVHALLVENPKRFFVFTQAAD